MKKYFVVLICLMFLSSFVVSEETIKFPGHIWGEVRSPNSLQVEDEKNWMIGGVIEQGVDWLTSNNGFSLNTFVEARYGIDKVGHDWNNFFAPAIGIKIKKPVTYNGIIQFGAKYMWERRWKTDREARGFMLFANWWFGWEL